MRELYKNFLHLTNKNDAKKEIDRIRKEGHQLINQGKVLWAEGTALIETNLVEGNKLRKEGYKCSSEGDALLINSVILEYIMENTLE